MSEKRTRRRGKGSLQSYQTKSGMRWRFQIWVPIDPEQPELGEKKYSRAGFVTSDEADDAMQESIRKRKNDERFHGSVPTLQQYGTEWLDALTLQPSTLLGYRRQFNNYIVPHLGSRPLDKITGPAVGKLYKLLRESGGKDGAPLSSNTVKKTSITLAAILDAAMEDSLIVKNPARLTKIVKAPTSRDIRAEREEMITWSAEQLKAFLDWDQTQEDDLYELWLTIARTGMRRGEALALQWRDLDHDAGRISIRRSADVAVKGRVKVPKSGSARVIDADAQLMAALKKLKSVRGSISLDLARPTAFIFGHYDDGRLRNPTLVSKRWGRRTAAAAKQFPDLPHIPIHGLRHTHATLLMMLGESPKVVQERLGHASIQITLDLYSHVMPSMQKAAADRFSELLG